MKTLILIDGPKGCGKTTMGEALAHSYRIGHEWERQSVLHTEPDFFFWDKGGNYNYDASKIVQAHTWCKVKVKAAMRKDENIIIISHHWDNNWQKKYYLELAKKYGYDIQEIFLKSHFVEKPTIEKLIEVVNETLAKAA